MSLAKTTVFLICLFVFFSTIQSLRKTQVSQKDCSSKLSCGTIKWDIVNNERKITSWPDSCPKIPGFEKGKSIKIIKAGAACTMDFTCAGLSCKGKKCVGKALGSNDKC